MNPALPVVYLVRPTLTALRIDRMLPSPLQRAFRAAELAMPHARVEADDDHDLTEPVIHAWNGHITAVASAR